MKKPRATKSKSKKPQRIRKVPTVEIVSELPKRPEPGKEFDLKERGLPGRRIVEFPQMEGRKVQAVRFHSNTDENTVSITFRDRTQLSLHFEPALVLRARASQAQEMGPGHSQGVAAHPQRAKKSER